MTDEHTIRSGIAEVESEGRSVLAEGVQKVREKRSEIGRRAADAIDSRRDSMAKGLESVAEGIHERTDKLAEGGSKVSRAAHTAADKIGSAADYVRDHDTKAMISDLESLVRTHPGKALLAVLAVGFLAGRAMHRD